MLVSVYNAAEDPSNFKPSIYTGICSHSSNTKLDYRVISISRFVTILDYVPTP